MLRQFSLGTLGLLVGGVITIIGFVAYATDNPTLNLVGFFYGVPLVLGGLALKAAELEPIGFEPATTPELLELRSQQATSTQNQIIKDVTRYRYGQSTHLEPALESLGLMPKGEDAPKLQFLREENTAGQYTLILHFETDVVPFETWQTKRDRMEKFFGPGIKLAVTQPQTDVIELALTTTTSAASTIEAAA